MLSVLTVLNNADSGTGSLRAAIAAAQNGIKGYTAFRFDRPSTAKKDGAGRYSAGGLESTSEGQNSGSDDVPRCATGLHVRSGYLRNKQFDCPQNLLHLSLPWDTLRRLQERTLHMLPPAE